VKSLSPKIYDKEYYLNSNLGSEEYKKYKGKKVHVTINNFANLLGDVKGKRILDLGCGRGDLVIELARRGAISVGVDYSKDGIDLAKDALKIQSGEIKKRVNFFVKDIVRADFENESFDIIVSSDVFEHLYKDELEIVVAKLSKILKPNGYLLIHTAPNKIYQDFTHVFYCYWMDLFLLKIYNFISKNNYPGLPKDPRNDLHKKQHVNEPTYLYLSALFKRHNFEGQIDSIVPYKPNLSWKDKIYNIIVYIYPISNYFPLNLIFATEYICKQNKASKN